MSKATGKLFTSGSLSVQMRNVNAVLSHKKTLANGQTHFPYLVLVACVCIKFSFIFSLCLLCLFNALVWLKPIDSCGAHNRPRRALAFLPLLMSSLLTKIGIIYAQLLQEKKIFPVIRVIGRMEPEICTKMPQKVARKAQIKISCHYTWLLYGKNCLSR